MAVPARKSSPIKIEAAEALVQNWPAPNGEAGWSNSARSQAIARFIEMGAPVRRDEYWRYTDPAKLTALPAPQAAVLGLDEPEPFEAAGGPRIVFVDGSLDLDQSDTLALEGVEIEPLDMALATDIHWVRAQYGTLEARGQDPVDRPLAALNTARAVQGLVIRVTGRAAAPVRLIYLHRDTGSDAMIHHVIRVEQDADLTLLETGAIAARGNLVMEIDIADGGRLHHVRSQGRDHERRTATAMFARLGAGSSFKSFTLSVNGRLTRNECVIEFTGDAAHATVAGAAAGEGDFHHDDTVFIMHDAVDCESRQVFKKVLKAGAVGVFQGKILVKPGAQKTDGYQISQGLLLDEASQFLAKPELEIYADDVACSHGSTVGAVDETALFYLTSRGIPRADAEGLLVLAFLDEAISEIEDGDLADEMRAQLAGWMSRRLTD